MVSLYELRGNEIVSNYNNLIPDEVTSRLSDFNRRIAELYVEKQRGKVGIRSLGNEIRYDEFVGEIFNLTNPLLVRATRNRSEVLNVHLSSLDIAREHDISEIYYVMLSEDLNSSSAIFDKTSITLNDWKENIALLHRNFSQLGNVSVYFIEIEQINGYSFRKHDSKYTKIIPQSNV